MRSQCLLIVFVLVASGSSLCATEVPIDFRANCSHPRTALRALPFAGQQQRGRVPGDHRGPAS